MSAHVNAALVALLEEFAREYKLGSAETLLAGAGFRLHGAGFCFHYNKAWPDFLTVYCEFGQVPEALREGAWRVLLEANLIMSHTGTLQQGFGLDPDTGAVIAAGHQPVAELDLERLREWLSDLAEQVMLWRADYFLAGELPEPVPTTPSHWLARQRKH